MVNKVKVLIGDDSVEYGIACASRSPSTSVQG